MYTSGTTGKPKGAALSGVGLAVQTCLGGKIESALVPGDVFYSLNDNSWAGSEFHALLPVWLNGATLLWQEGAAFARPSLSRFYETIEKYRVNKVHLAPTVLRMLRAAGDGLLEGRDLSRLELMLVYGGTFKSGTLALGLHSDWPAADVSQQRWRYDGTRGLYYPALCFH